MFNLSKLGRLVIPYCVLYVTIFLPVLPLLEVITITPVPPLAPYIAAAVASFNTVIDSKSKKELIYGIFSGVKMEWETNTTIKAYSYLGIVEMDNENPEKLYEIIKVE